MPERWREALGRLDSVGPDREKLRRGAALGPRMTESGSPAGRRLLTGAVAAALTVTSVVLVFSMFRPAPVDVSSPSPPSPSVPTDPSIRSPGALDPAAICDVPPFDPDVALLVGSETVEYPISVLEGPGEPASSLTELGSDALRDYLASPAAVHAPADGWRAVATSPDAVTFAAPHDPDSGSWWVVGFGARERTWERVQEEIVDQELTPAQRGRGMELRWDGEVVLEDGRWDPALRLENGRSSNWVDGDGKYYLGAAHTFDGATGREVGPGVAAIGGQAWPAHELSPGGHATVPLALGANLGSLSPGTYDVVACIPDLGLASPVGTLRVVNDARVRDVRVLTYEFTGVSMEALAIGSLDVMNGCLAIEDNTHSTYILWPEGYAVVHRADRTVLIDPTGAEVGALGDEVTLGGGYAGPEHIDEATIDGMPEECRSSGEGEGYFITSGAA